MTATHTLNTNVFSAKDSLKAGTKVVATPSVAEHGFYDIRTPDYGIVILRVSAKKLDPWREYGSPPATERGSV